jgi:hypothetical protein
MADANGHRLTTRVAQPGSTHACCSCPEVQPLAQTPHLPQPPPPTSLHTHPLPRRCLQHIYVTAQNVAACATPGSSTLAYASACQRDQNDRPIFGCALCRAFGSTQSSSTAPPQTASRRACAFQSLAWLHLAWSIAPLSCAPHSDSTSTLAPCTVQAHQLVPQLRASQSNHVTADQAGN